MKNFLASTPLTRYVIKSNQNFYPLKVFLDEENQNVVIMLASLMLTTNSAHIFFFKTNDSKTYHIHSSANIPIWRHQPVAFISFPLYLVCKGKKKEISYFMLRKLFVSSFVSMLLSVMLEAFFCHSIVFNSFWFANFFWLFDRIHRKFIFPSFGHYFRKNRRIMYKFGSNIDKYSIGTQIWSKMLRSKTRDKGVLQ